MTLENRIAAFAQLGRRLQNLSPEEIENLASRARSANSWFDLPNVTAAFQGIAGGDVIDGKAPQTPISEEFYYIVSDKCTECVGFHEEPQCAAVCPVDCCVDDPDYRETQEELTAKQQWLHAS